MPPRSKAACNEVSTVLWRERDLLDGLAYRLEVQRLVLLPGNDRWLPRACRDVEVELDRLSSAELVRAVRVDTLADELGLHSSPSLRTIVDAVGEPWKEIFTGHQKAFHELTGEVLRLAEHNRMRLREGRELSFAASGWLHYVPAGQGGHLGRSVHPLLDEDR